MEGLNFQVVLDLLAKWVPILLRIVGTAAVVATLTPNKNDDRIVQFILDLVNFLGGNVGKSRNIDH